MTQGFQMVRPNSFNSENTFEWFKLWKYNRMVQTIEWFNKQNGLINRMDQTIEWFNQQNGLISRMDQTIEWFKQQNGLNNRMV